MSTTTYTRRWFADQAEGSGRSAELVVPLIVDLLRPESVVDVGCGLGAWLSEFVRAGVEDVHGLDGDYVERSMLAIPAERFRAHDLTRPLPAERRFDLAVSIEVAEHLPPHVGEQFVEGLTTLAPAVLFGAAVPGQGGSGHLNERWQSYWAGLFAERGYVLLDVIRPLLWSDPHVHWWYRQNTFLFVTPEHVAADERLRRLAETGPTTPLDVVHPELFGAVREQALRPGRDLVRRQAARARRALRAVLPRG